MAGFPCVHHIEVGVVDGPGAVNILRSKFTFKLQAVRSTDVVNQWLLVKNDTRFLVTSLKTQDRNKIKNDDFVVDWRPSAWLEQSPELRPPSKDSVFNVAFQVKNIDACIQRLKGEAVTFSKPLHTVSDSSGSVRSCAIKSCVGDIYHTLIEKKNYSGYFLPGFSLVDGLECGNSQESLDSMVESFDHVALAVEMNSATSVIGWYERCFGMKRFLINRDEEEDNGLVLSTNNVGLRLRAMEYWKCAEVGLMTPEEEGVTARLSMVIAEGLPPAPGSTEENQIESWMRQHGGPGIQHVAITSSNIKTTVANLKSSGAEFAKAPPPAYYSEVGRLYDIQQAGEDLEALKDNGILIDTEADGIHDVTQYDDNATRKERYLLQIFTKPVFSKDPFFLEIIQREGATGFGSGNIAALYRSVQACIVGEKHS